MKSPLVMFQLEWELDRKISSDTDPYRTNPDDSVTIMLSPNLYPSREFKDGHLN